MVEADFMAEVVFTEAEVAGSSASWSFSHRSMEKDLHLQNMRIERQVAMVIAISTWSRRRIRDEV